MYLTVCRGRLRAAIQASLGISQPALIPVKPHSRIEQMTSYQHAPTAYFAAEYKLPQNS
jgi:hypothetical protein